jgi:two-component system OmpR family response regulator
MARILYIDDEADIREVAMMALELDPEFQVRSCGSGAEGIDEAAEWQPDLILLDVMMPGLDGPDTLARLRALPSTARIPVVFITARTQAHDVQRLQALGAAGVIAKPFDPMGLPHLVRGYLPD